MTKQLSLWKKDSGDPRNSNPTLKDKFDGKLVGNYDFPFSMPFPAYVDLASSSTANMEQMASPTPQTFIERGITATVTYTISVLFIHGWFKHESRSVSDIVVYAYGTEQLQNQNKYRIPSGFSTSSCFAEETASIRSRRLHSWTVKRPRWLVYIAKCYNPWYHHLSRLAQADQDRL